MEEDLKMKIGQLEIDLEELRNFLVIAKKNAYAGGGVKKREIDGSKTFTFQEGNFHYTDNYAGSYQAPGNEIVRWQRVPVFSCGNYINPYRTGTANGRFKCKTESRGNNL